MITILLFAILFILVTHMLAKIISQDGVLDLTVYMVSFISILCINAFFAGLLNIFSIPIASITTLISLLIQALLYFLLSKHKTCRITVTKYDVAIILLITLLMFQICLHIFGTDIRWSYFNSDPSVHFTYAMDIFRTKELDGMYFACLFNSTLLELFSKVVDYINLYKVYILSDCFINFIQLLFFYSICRNYLANRKTKLIFPIILVLFFWGYPLYSFMIGGYNYWGTGCMLLIYTLYWLLRYTNEPNNRKWITYFLSLGCFSTAVCYMIFAPYIFITVFSVLLYHHYSDYKFTALLLFIKKCLRVFIVPTILCFYYCFIRYFNGNVSEVATAANTDAGTFDVWDSFVFLIPLILWFFYHKYKQEKENVVLCITYVIMLANMAMFAVLCYKDILSPYYYNKMNYPLWILSWLLIVILMQENESHFSIYFAFLSIISFSSIFLLEEKTTDSGERLIIGDKIWIYQENSEKYSHMNWDFNFMDDEKKEIYNYVLQSQTNAVMIGDPYCVSEMFLYGGVTGHKSKFYFWNNMTIEESIETLKNHDIYHFVVLKDSEYYTNNSSYLSSIPIVVENDLCALYRIDH